MSKTLRLAAAILMFGGLMAATSWGPGGKEGLAQGGPDCGAQAQRRLELFEQQVAGLTPDIQHGVHFSECTPGVGAHVTAYVYPAQSSRVLLQKRVIDGTGHTDFHSAQGYTVICSDGRARVATRQGHTICSSL